MRAGAGGAAFGLALGGDRGAVGVGAGGMSKRLAENCSIYAGQVVRAQQIAHASFIVLRLPPGGSCGKDAHAAEFAGIGLIELVFAGVVGPIGIVAEHGRRNAKSDEDIVIAALHIVGAFRLPVVASAGGSIETGLACLISSVGEQRVEE